MTKRGQCNRVGVLNLRDKNGIISSIFRLFGSNPLSCNTSCTCNANLFHALVNRLNILRGPHEVTMHPRDRRRVGYSHCVGAILSDIPGKGNNYLETYQQVILTKTGALRLRYIKALAGLRILRAMPMSYLKKHNPFSFAPFTKHGERKVEGTFVKPRAIVPQVFRSPVDHEFFHADHDGWHKHVIRVNEPLYTPILIELVYSRWISRCLHAVMNPTNETVPVFTTSQNPVQVARDVLRLSSDHKYLWYSLDISNMDGNEDWKSVDVRSAFLALARDLFPDFDHQYLELVLESQDRAKLQSPGLKGSVYGNRQSGTASTCPGNKIVAYAAVRFGLGRLADLCAYKIAGDDMLIGVPVERLSFFEDNVAKSVMDSFIRRTKSIGFEFKIEGVNEDVTKLPFCRSVIEYRDDGKGGVEPIYMKPIVDLLTNLVNVTRNVSVNGINKHYFATLRVGFIEFTRGLPIFNAVGCIYPIDSKSKVDNRYLSSSGIEYIFKGFDLKNLPRTPDLQVSDSVREKFHIKYGIPPAMQILHEQRLSTAAHFIDWDSKDWLFSERAEFSGIPFRKELLIKKGGNWEPPWFS